MKKDSTSRPKLDTKLAYILSLSIREITTIKSEEEKRLKKNNSRRDEDGQEKAKAELFSPLLHAVEIPRPQDKVKHPLRVPYISAFIKFLGSKNDLEELGVKVRAQAGDVFTAYIPLRLVPKLEKIPAVKFIELAKTLFQTLDEAIPNTQINTLHSAASAVNGAGVIVGVVDSGIDFYHTNFRNNDGIGLDGLGSTRILRFWDQTLIPIAGEASPLGFAYGVEYTQANINNELTRFPAVTPYSTVRHNAQASADSSGALCVIGSTDTGVHGTHVTGIAAGNGRQADDCGAASIYTGAAPNADIIFVRNRGVAGITRLSDSTNLADACSYIFNQAAALAEPCVINISQSDDQGPHDGSLLSQEFLDNLIDLPGKAITLSAGNSNGNNSHASGIVTAGGTQNVILNYLVSANNNDVIEIWYDGHDRFNITVTAPDGTSSGVVTPGLVTMVTMSNGQNLRVDSRLNDARNNDNLITIIINANAANQIPNGNWTIRLNGTTVINGRFRMWVDRNNRLESDFLAPHVTNNEMTIADLATTKRAITVGNHQKTNAISGSSACGPTRDGRIKPEIAAIGSSVMSTRSRDIRLAAPGNFYFTLSGTSMSAPLVAGAAALLFQCKGAGLTWFDIKQVFEDTADVTGIAVPHNAFGFGRLLMGSACTTPATDVDVWLREYTGDLGNEPASTVSWACPDIEVLDQSHNPIANPIYNVVGGTQQDNFIRVTVRNRGTQIARNTEVYFYWGDPATALHFSTDWNVTGIFTPTGTPSQWVNQGNKIVIPSIPAMGNVQVEFRWLPPVPGSNLRGDNHFCLLARLENEADPSMMATIDGWAIFAADNNVAIRNVLIQDIDVPGDAEFSFFSIGTGGADSLVIETDIPKPVYKIELPDIAIPYRSLKFLNGLTCVDVLYSDKPTCNNEYNLKDIKIEKEESVKMLTDINGAVAVHFDNGIATIFVEGNPKVHIEKLRLAKGARLPVKITLKKKGLKQEVYHLTVNQFSDGRKVGGVVLELHRKHRDGSG
jgi:subtilisin family serine protease